jgi:hypothetical protein
VRRRTTLRRQVGRAARPSTFGAGRGGIVGGEDPSYQTATDHNLVSHNGGWSQGEKAVDADLDGMADFVANMGTLQDNLATHSWYFTEVSELPHKGLGVKGYEEGVGAMRMISANAAEFQEYFQMLKQAHLNIAMGGQTCIDAMGGKDDLNGISLNAVNFALAIAGTKQPPGLPPALAKQLGETWQDVYSKQLAAQPDPASGGGETSKWTPGGSGSSGPTSTPGMTTKTMTDQYGNTRTIATTKDKGTTIITETSADGRTVTTTETVKVGSTTTTTITRQENLFTKKEKTTTTTSTSTTQHTDHSTITTRTGANGKPVSQESVVESRDGTTTTTETTYDGKGNQHDDPGVTVGHERPDPKLPTSPVPAAMKSIK